MNQLDNKINFGTRINPITANEQSSFFLHLHSSELKYMNPWAQYDENINRNNKYQAPKNKIGIDAKQNTVDLISVMNIGK